MKFKSIASLIAITAATLSFMAPARAQVDLVPEQEGEIEVGLGVLDDSQSLALSLFPFIENIVSELDATTNSKSRLFIDNLNTANEYGTSVKFGTRDRGTNHEGYWFRPSDSEETGSLEVGTFTFNFSRTLQKLNIDFFDTESSETTGLVGLNGSELETVNWVSNGKDGNIVTQTFYDVNSITLKLGKDFDRGTGDGVNFRMSATPIPEPATLGGLAVVGLAFAGQKLRKGRKA